MTFRPAFAAVLAGAVCLAASVDAQAPAGQKIQAKNGDLILVENADRVRVVRRREGQVRAIYNGQQRWLVVLADFASPGADPDGRVDMTYRYHDLTSDWPLGERWEGRVQIEEYSLAGEVGPASLGLMSPVGLIQVLAFRDHDGFVDRSAAASIAFRGSGRGGRGQPFDVAEPQEVAQASARGAVPVVAPSGSGSPGPQPIRVGGNIRVPAKIHDVRPVYPDEALKARITGLVILEAVIGVNGAVTDARVLKSIPVLDAAAVDAVRQWRFEPTLLNGAAVPVIMTVTVNFSLQ